MEWSSAFQKLVSHNPDIGRLVAEGYAVAFDSNHLVVRDVCHLDAQGECEIGSIVIKLIAIDADRFTFQDHVAHFAGSIPHGLDGQPIPYLKVAESRIILPNSPDVLTEHMLSTKPASGSYDDLYHQVSHYVAVVSGPATEKHGISPLTYKVDGRYVEGSIFKFHDTLTSRAEISDLAALLNDEVVAIIGLGGTGSYILDYMVKAPVKEIRAFDADDFHVHNAFRSPGRQKESEFGKSKAVVYQNRYAQFRHGLEIQAKYIDDESGSDLEGVTFAFVSVDKGSARSQIFDLLIEKGIPFIDVGMGLSRKQGSLSGMARMTYYSAEEGQARKEAGFAAMEDNPNEEYRANVQIGELNALNACVAVIKYKQLKGFYHSNTDDFNYLFDIADLKIVS